MESPAGVMTAGKFRMIRNLPRAVAAVTYYLENNMNFLKIATVCVGESQTTNTNIIPVPAFWKKHCVTNDPISTKIATLSKLGSYQQFWTTGIIEKFYKGSWF